MNWIDSEPWEPKFARLLRRIDDLAAQGWAVALVGASAGGSAVINAYAERSNLLVGCVVISGKINHPDTIGMQYLQRYPSFVTSAKACPAALDRLTASDRARLLSRYSQDDSIVPPADSHIPGALNQIASPRGHLLTIATQITLGAPSFIRFLKRLPRS